MRDYLEAAVWATKLQERNTGLNTEQVVSMSLNHTDNLILRYLIHKNGTKTELRIPSTESFNKPMTRTTFPSLPQRLNCELYLTSHVFVVNRMVRSLGELPAANQFLEIPEMLTYSPLSVKESAGMCHATPVLYINPSLLSFSERCSPVKVAVICQDCRTI